MIKTNDEILAMRTGGKILGSILQELGSMVAPGVSTETLNTEAERQINEAGTMPAFKDYTMQGTPPFPCSLCTSINDEVVHGPALPDRILEEGDIVGLDLGLIYTENNVSVYLDAAITVGVGSISKEAKKLIEVTRESLAKGLEQIRDSATTGDIGFAVQKYVESHDFSVIRELVGHGVGKEIHEPPQIPNYGKKGLGEKLKAGMTIAVEPMVSAGTWQLDFTPGTWWVRTKDHSLSAHFEHTVLVTKNGCEILTKK